MVNYTHTFEESDGDNYTASYTLQPGYHVALAVGHQRYAKINGD